MRLGGFLTYVSLGLLLSCQSRTVEERVAQAILSKANELDQKKIEKQIQALTNQMSEAQKTKLKEEAKKLIDRL